MVCFRQACAALPKTHVHKLGKMHFLRIVKIGPGQYFGAIVGSPTIKPCAENISGVGPSDGSVINQTVVSMLLWHQWPDST